MRSDRSAVPARPGQRLPARHGGASGSGEVHSAGHLSFTDSVGTREEVWEQLGPKIQERVNAKIGQVVEWWATNHSGRNAAVVLGTEAFVTVEPTINAAGKPAHEIRALRLDGATFRRATVTGAPPPRAAAPAARTVGPGSPPSAPTSALSRQLGSGMTGFLGHLPVRAQQLLQEPFVDDHADLWHDYYFFQPGSGHGLGGGTLRIWCYLANRRYVTFAAGTGHGYREETGPRSWELTCWRAEVTGNPR
ncbi:MULTISPECIES: hypothetical protein [unclassified Saccharothrix]|uniref:hypothetical protein n=1 Tax=unclassified Saccharothrix TaxID=2593673 RepID=UPI00307DC089